MNKIKLIVYLCVGIIISSALYSGETISVDAKLKIADKSSKQDIFEYTLENGLKVVIKPIHRVPLVTTFINYKVGSAYESTEYQGVSHFLEHLMFKGTSKLKKGDIDKITQMLGGENNAFTGSDYTAYHFQFPKKNWLKALEIEADRMRNCSFEEQEFLSERNVVIEEINEDLDEPWNELDKFITPKVYGEKHGYGHAILGSEVILRKLTPEKVKKYYDKYYHPGNAVLVIVGAIDPENAIKNVKKFFGSIPSNLQADSASESAVDKKTSSMPGIYNLYRDVNVGRISINYLTVPITHPDYPALMVLDNILSAGDSSRIQQEIVEKSGLAQSAGSWSYSREQSGEFGFWAEFAVNQPIKTIIAGWEEIIDKIRKIKPEQREVQKTINKVLSSVVFSKQKIYSIAKDIGYYKTLFDKPHYQAELIEKISEVTCEQVQNVAKKYFEPKQAIIAVMIPEPKVIVEEVKADGFVIQKFKLENGLTVELVEEHELPMVALDLNFHLASLRETNENNGVFNLLGQMLTQGTKNLNSDEIADKIDFLGVNIETSGDGITAAVLRKDLEEFLGLVSEMATKSTFPEARLELKKKVAISDLKSSLDEPATLARREFTKLLYPPTHPYGNIETVDDLQAISAADLANFYKKHFIPNNATLRVVGDISAYELNALVVDLFSDWVAGVIEPLELPELSQQKEDKAKYIHVEGKIQSVIYIGHLGIKRSNPDYYALLVLDNILGTGAGFTDRLNADLRDTQGFAYSVWMVIGETARYDYGKLIGNIATTPENIVNSVAGMIKHLRKIRDELVTDDEIGGAKAYLTGSFPATFESYEDLVSTLGYIGSYKLGLNYFKEFPEKILSVTKDDILKAAKKYLNPEALSLVIAGNIDIQKNYLELARELLTK